LGQRELAATRADDDFDPAWTLHEIEWEPSRFPYKFRVFTVGEAVSFPAQQFRLSDAPMIAPDNSVPA
jgi:hypothetical protein